MPLSIFLYIIFGFFLFGTGIYTYKKYKKYSGLFFLLSCFFMGLWSILYVLIYGFINDKNILLFVFRFMYNLSFLGFYSMILFIYFFNKEIKKIHRNFILLVYFLISILFTFTPFVVEKLKYIEEKNYYFEDYGVGYNIVIFFYLIFTPLLGIVSYYKIKSLNYINKVRLKNICIGFGSFIFLSIFFLVLLPYFGIYLFENNIILFSIPFIFSVLYSTKYYNFSDFKLKIGKIIVFLFSIFSSIFLVNIIKYYSSNLSVNYFKFWQITEDSGTVDILLGIIFFALSYYFLCKKFLLNTRFDKYEIILFKIKKHIPFITSLDDLNIFLQTKIKQIFNINHLNIKLCSENDTNKELYKYFTKDLSRDLFINDIVFIEENKYKFDEKKIRKEINKKSYLIYPLINNKKELIGIFELGYKPFKDHYYLEEIKIIKNFVDFLVGHLRYIEIYSKINDLNINLDKKVDKKTIQYNTLLSKQREFISMSSHEIKTPVASSIFQIDCILDDFKNKEFDKKYFKKELNILNEQLLKLGDLVNKIFTVQEYDIKDIKLFIERINIKLLLQKEIDRFKKFNKDTEIILKIEKDIKYVDIDKVQFTQVIDNLLHNSTKFSNKNSSIIKIKLFLEGDNIIFNIEDNGKGFKNINVSTIFDKYITGKVPSVGIGLGLYLCKKIIKMHKGTIKVKKSTKLGGANFIFSIPKNSLD